MPIDCRPRTPVPLALALLLLATPAMAAAEPVPLVASLPHITATGSAHVEVKPDLATIHLGVVIERPTPEDALAEGARLVKAAFDALRANGIVDHDVHTTTLDLTPIYDEDRNDHGQTLKRTLRGYRAQNLFAVRLHDVDGAGIVARRVLDAGANVFTGVTFDLEGAPARRQALAGEAARDARRQAEAYAAGLGLSLGRVLEIMPDTGRAPNFRVMAASPGADTARGNPPPIPLAAGLLAIDAAVTVTFELKTP